MKEVSVQSGTLALLRTCPSPLGKKSMKTRGQTPTLPLLDDTLLIWNCGIIQIPRIQFQHLHRPLFPSALRMCSMLQMCTSLGQGVAIWKTKYRAWTSGTSKISTGMHRRPLCGARVRDSDRRLGFTSSDTKL